MHPDYGIYNPIAIAPYQDDKAVHSKIACFFSEYVPENEMPQVRPRIFAQEYVIEISKKHKVSYDRSIVKWAASFERFGPTKKL